MKKLSMVLKYTVWVLLIADLLFTLLAPVWLLNVDGGFLKIDLLKVLFMEDMSEVQRVFVAAFTVYCGLISAGILYETTFLLRSVAQGNPFCYRNAKSLLLSSYLAFALGIGFAARGFVIPSFLTWVCAGGTLLMGLILVVLSCLFKQAAQLKEENELTI